MLEKPPANPRYLTPTLTMAHGSACDVTPALPQCHACSTPNQHSQATFPQSQTNGRCCYAAAASLLLQPSLCSPKAAPGVASCCISPLIASPLDCASRGTSSFDSCMPLSRHAAGLTASLGCPRQRQQCTPLLFYWTRHSRSQQPLLTGSTCLPPSWSAAPRCVTVLRCWSSGLVNQHPATQSSFRVRVNSLTNAEPQSSVRV